MGAKPHPEHRISAKAHFLTGIGLIDVVAILSSFINEHPLFHKLQLTNLDVLFLSDRTLDGVDHITLVSITDRDYEKLFGNTSPPQTNAVGDLIVACARSRAKVIRIDLVTSQWSAEERETVVKAAGQAYPGVRIVWAVDGWIDEKTGQPRVDPLKGLDPGPSNARLGVPAAIPDELGVVSGFLTGIRAGAGSETTAFPAMAVLIDRLFRNRAASCPPDAESGQDSAEQFATFSGGKAFVENLPASTVPEVSKGQSCLNSNPLADKIVLIGGSFRQARDRCLAPAGYMDGVAILGQTVLSQQRGVHQTSIAWFVLSDIVVGLTLLTATWLLHRVWAMVLSFLFIPFISMAASLIAFNGFGYFASFVPVVTGVLLHHLVEYVLQHRRMAKELHLLSQTSASTVPQEQYSL
jgi:CHASE2 domain-containing sensor protein